MGTLGSQMLQEVAEQLQNYMQAVNLDDDLVVTGCNKRDSKRAAVLICLFEGSHGEIRVLLTKRSINLSSYPGDVALPGGKMEEGDNEDDSATALREAKEEIGLDSNLVRIVANLQPFISQHLLRVVPVIGILNQTQNFKPVLNIHEVDAVFDVPLDMFLKEDNYRREEREWMGMKYNYHLFYFETEQQETSFVIQGLTASILIKAASLIYRQSPFSLSSQLHLPDFQQLLRDHHLNMINRDQHH